MANLPVLGLRNGPIRKERPTKRHQRYQACSDEETSMPHKMNNQEIKDFMLDAPRTGHVATVRADGRPHVAPVWLTVDGDDVVFATASASVKGRNILRSGFASVSVDDSAPPFSYVVVEGPVTIVDDMNQVRHWARAIAARYMSDAWAKAYVEHDGFPDDIICRLTPSQMTGHAALAE
jgi:PPOX class probable F420-dependent enzyme